MLGPFAPDLIILRLFMKFEVMTPQVKVPLKVFACSEILNTSFFRAVKQLTVLLICWWCNRHGDYMRNLRCLLRCLLQHPSRLMWFTRRKNNFHPCIARCIGLPILLSSCFEILLPSPTRNAFHTITPPS